MPYRVIIIDDEEPARDLVSYLLSQYSEFEVVAKCENGFKGYKAIQDLAPDLIFLDVQMPKISGFEMLELMDVYPAIIFTTAFDEYAIKAFDMNAVDYLLKPFGKDRFNQAMEKAMNQLAHGNTRQESVEKLVETRPEHQPFLDRIVVKTGLKIKVIPIDQVQYFEADDDYVQVHTGEGRFLKQQTMKYYEANLDQTKFIRVHRSFIVRISEIVQIEPYEKDSKVIVLRSGRKIKVSKSGLKTLKEVLGV